MDTVDRSNRRQMLAQTFSALKYRNYRLWFFGQLTSLVGTWMQNTAQGYLIYTLTQSPAYLGYVGFAAGLPSWLFMLYGGVITDRISRRTLLIITQAAMMVLAFIQAALVVTNLVQPWHIIVLAFLLGIANAFDTPARQTIIVDLVEREDLTNAIAMNATMFNLAVVVGPSAAGMAYAALGPAWCFFINGLSFIAVIVGLLLMRIETRPRPPRKQSTLQELLDGFRYVKTDQIVQTLIVNIGVLSLFGMSMMTLLPAWSVEVLHGDVTTNGLLVSSRGVGALAGALMIAAIGHRNIKGKIWLAGSFLMPVMMGLFALAHWLPLSLLLMTGLGWSFMVQANTSNAMIQTRVDDQLRGRVLSIYSLVFFGAFPVGSLLVGELALRVGEVGTLFFYSLVLMAAALLVFWRRPEIRELP
jgi:MFS family permease